jgi:hypothetical protein
MQSSGASLLAYFLAQKPNTIALIDLYSSILAPTIILKEDVALKCVVTSRYSLREHQDSFNPAKTILFLREPCRNYASLSTKSYRDESGSIDDKFRILESEFVEGAGFDLILRYEDLVASPERALALLDSEGIPVSSEACLFQRPMRDIIDSAPYTIRTAFGFSWGCGGLRHGEGIRADGTAAAAIEGRLLDHLKTLCPSVCAVCA